MVNPSAAEQALGRPARGRLRPQRRGLAVNGRGRHEKANGTAKGPVERLREGTFFIISSMGNDSMLYLDRQTWPAFFTCRSTHPSSSLTGRRNRCAACKI